MQAKISSINDLSNESVSHDADVKKKVIIRRGDVPHLMQLAETKMEPGQKASKHSHSDMTEVFIVKEGTGEIELDNKTSPIFAENVITIPPGVSHEIRNNSNSTLTLLYFGIQH